MPVTVKYENIPKSEIRKKEKEKRNCKEKSHKEGEVYSKRKNIHGKKNKKPLKTRNKTPAFQQQGRLHLLTQIFNINKSPHG